MKFADLRGSWSEFSAKAKWMAAGTVAILACSVAFSFSSCSAPQEWDVGTRLKTVAVEEGVEIPADAEAIPIASKEARLVTALSDALTNRNCVWVSPDDDVSWVEFAEGGFTEHNGDLTRTATVEFFSIEVVENGRQGTWRVTYEDGSVYEASFLFVQNRETGVYAFTSSAFTNHKTYQTKAITSEDVLAW